MAKQIFIILALILSINVKMSAQDISVVRQFANNLSNWASGENTFSSVDNIERLCKPTFRVSDKIMQTLAKKNGWVLSKNYTLENYITCMQKEIDKGISINVTDIQNVSLSEILNAKKEYSYVSCNISISGSMQLNENALFLLSDNKIAGIQNNITRIDRKTGKKKIEIDWSSLNIDEDTKGFGVSYNYSKAFPFGASIAYSKWKFMIGLDFGINNDKDIYTTQKVYFDNIVDYKIVRGEYNLKYFITVTPSFYMKYFSVGWGAGYAYLKGTQYTRESNIIVHPDGTTIQTGSTTPVNDFKYKLMMRPTVKGYIPCSDNFFISLSVNYDWIVGYKEKSGVGFGAGLHILFN